MSRCGSTVRKGVPERGHGQGSTFWEVPPDLLQQVGDFFTYQTSDIGKQT